MLKIADLERDADLLEQAQSLADDLLKNHPLDAQKHLERWLSRGDELVKV